MLGDQALFTASDGIERLWEISMPLLDNPTAGRVLRTGIVGPASRSTQLIAPLPVAAPGVRHP